MSLMNWMFGIKTTTDWQRDYWKKCDELKKVADRLHAQRVKNAELAQQIHAIKGKATATVPRAEFDELMMKFKDAHKNYSDCEQRRANKVTQELANARQSELALRNTVTMIVDLMRKHRIVPRKRLAAVIGRNDLAKWRKS